MKEVLVIEDDKSIVELVSIHLKDLNCQITKHHNGTEGLIVALDQQFDLIILDIMLPGTDGMDICRHVRAKGINTPILFLTAKSEEIDKVLGLESGGDDYMSKPFSIREFVARVKAIFRRVEMQQANLPNSHPTRITFNKLHINTEKRKVTIQGERIALTPKEFDLLVLLASNPGRSYSRESLLTIIWGYEFGGYEHTVNSHINRLRTKIETELSNPKYILTTWGIGYRFADKGEI